MSGEHVIISERQSAGRLMSERRGSGGAMARRAKTRPNGHCLLLGKRLQPSIKLASARTTGPH